jgi:hypothetical protein
MHVLINVKSPNNISKWQMGFNSAFKGLRFNYCVRKIPVLYHINSIHVDQWFYLRSISKLSYHKHTRPVAVAADISSTAYITVWVRIPFGLWRYFSVFAMSVQVQVLQWPAPSSKKSYKSFATDISKPRNWVALGRTDL